jgi:hypothetical protein
MSYAILIIIYTTLTNRIIEHNVLYAALSILLIYTLHKGYTMETFKELNMLYDNNLEIVYSFANISINKNNLLYIVLIIAVVALLKTGQSNIGIKKKQSMYLIESAVFYTGYYFNSYYIPKKEMHFPLHDNVISAVHPILTIVIYVMVMHILSERLHNENKNIEKSKLTIMYYMTVLTTLLGSLWASSTEGWGGIWIWDPTEILLLMLIILFIGMLHSSVNSVIGGTVYSTILILYFQLINKLSISDGIHNFYTNDLSSNAYYLSFIIVSVIVLLIPVMFKKIIKKPKVGIALLFIITVYYALKNYNILNSVSILNISFFTLLLILFYTSTTLHMNNKIELYIVTGIVIVTQYSEVAARPGLIIASYITLYLLSKKKLAWATANHFIHYAVFVFLIINYLEYKNWNYEDSQNMVNSSIVNQIETHFELQNITNSLLSSKMNIGNNGFFLEIEKYDDISNQGKMYFYTTIPNIIMLTFRNTTIDSMDLTMLYTHSLINLFNNKVLLTSYWIVVFLYIVLKKDNRW